MLIQTISWLTVHCSNFVFQFASTARCSDLQFPMCEGFLSYNRTYFPNPSVSDRNNSMTLIEGVSGITMCHEELLFILCGMLFPDCPHGGPTQRPCRTLCDDVEASCINEYRSATGKDWPIDCSDLSDSGDGRYCLGDAGGKVLFCYIKDDIKHKRKSCIGITQNITEYNLG